MPNEPYDWKDDAFLVQRMERSRRERLARVEAEVAAQRQVAPPPAPRRSLGESLSLGVLGLFILGGIFSFTVLPYIQAAETDRRHDEIDRRMRQSMAEQQVQYQCRLDQKVVGTEVRDDGETYWVYDREC